MFDPLEWYVLPDGAGVPRDALVPCPCGETTWEIRDRLYRQRGEGTTYRANVLVCPRCAKPNSDDHLLGRVEVRHERMVPVRGAA